MVKDGSSGDAGQSGFAGSCALRVGKGSGLVVHAAPPLGLTREHGTAVSNSLARLLRILKANYCLGMSLDPTLQESDSGGQVPGARKKLKARQYEQELARLQEELVRLQRWIRHKGLKVVIIFEGRGRRRQGAGSSSGSRSGSTRGW